MEANGVENEPMGYYSTQQAADKLGCSTRTISRAAQKLNVGIHLVTGRLVALSPVDLKAMRSVIHSTSGNPNWIAAASKRQRRKRT
jgi:hypothetical protein